MNGQPQSCRTCFGIYHCSRQLLLEGGFHEPQGSFDTSRKRSRNRSHDICPDTGEEFIKGLDVDSSPALQILYSSGETVGIDEKKFGGIQARQLSNQRAEIVYHSWDGDGVLSLSVDAETGDLLIETSAYSSRPGVLACRWYMNGLRPDLRLVAPFFQGIALTMDDPLIRFRQRSLRSCG